jgi:hypothetical protein
MTVLARASRQADWGGGKNKSTATSFLSSSQISCITELLNH